jgi:hypothetical protein
VPRTRVDGTPRVSSSRRCSLLLPRSRAVPETGAAALETASLGRNQAPHHASDERAEVKPSLGPRVAHAHPIRKKEVGPAGRGIR